MITPDLLHFLSELKANNNREWFEKHKTLFKAHETAAKFFFKEIHEKLSKKDDLEGHKLMRIYRDVRFSADKTPYKPRFAGSFSRATAALRGSYYLNIEPGNSIAGGGFYGPNNDDLKRIRQEFEMDDSEIREILENKQFKAIFGQLQGEALKTAPRGFDPNHKAIDLIKKKQFYAVHHFTDQEVLSPDFKDKIQEIYDAIRPYFDYMSSVLTTNTNGESLL